MPEAWERRWNRTRPLARVVGRLVFGAVIEGRDRLPSGPFVIAANHLSHVDPPFVGLAVEAPVRFMSAADLLGLNRGLDFALPFYGAIPLPRRGVALSAMKTALAHLDEGGRVGVFPEGRRTSHWGETTPLTGAAWLSLRAHVPLVPVAIIGTDRVMSLEANLPRPAKVSVRIGKPLKPMGDRFSLTGRWAEAVEGLLAESCLPIGGGVSMSREPKRGRSPQA